MRAVLAFLFACGSTYALSFSLDMLMLVFFTTLPFLKAIIPILVWLSIAMVLVTLAAGIGKSFKFIRIPFLVNAVIVGLAIPVHYYHVIPTMILSLIGYGLHRAYKLQSV